MKAYIPLIFIFQIITISVNQPIENLFDYDDSGIGNIYSRKYEKNSSCSNSQYFDEEQDHCLNITGGGTVLYIDKKKSCGVNVLKPHCSNPKRYYICKKNKTILVQCGEDQQFSYHLHKCISNNHEQSTEGIYSKRKVFDSIKLPTCEKPGTFPVPGDCTLFYICEIKDRRIFQSTFKCPNTMIYDAEMEICSFSAVCNYTNLNDVSSSCEPNTEKGIIEDKDQDDESRNTEMLNETSTTDYSSIPPQFTIENGIIDATVATNNYESIATDESNSSDTLNLTENILSTTYSLSTIDPITSTISEELNSSFQEETTDPSLKTSTSDDIILNKQYDMVETTTEDSITSSIDELEELSSSTQETNAVTLQTSTEIELNLNDRTDAVITNTMNSTSYSQVTDPFTTPKDVSTSTEVNMNELLIHSTTEQETSDPIVGLTIDSTTEFSSTDFTSIISSTESFTPPSNKTIISDFLTSIDDLFGYGLYTSTEATTSNNITNSSNFISTDYKSLLQNIVNNKITENSASSALLSTAVPDTVNIDRTAFSTSTDAANYLSTVPPESVTYGFDELIDTPSDIKQTLQNFTSTLNVVSSLESILAKINKNSTLDEVNKQPCEEMLQSLLTEINKNESIFKNVTDTEKQTVTTSYNINSRRTISSHIALPLVSAILNITDRFEHRIRDILEEMSKVRS